MKKILLTLAAVTAVLGGCRKTETVTAGKTGILCLQVAYEEEYNDKTPDLVPVKSSADGDLIDTFIISIVKTSGTQYSLECSVADFMEKYADGIISLSPGAYTVSVSSPASEKAAWDQPVYGASQNVIIMEDVMTPVELTCRLTNMKVTVKLSDNFKNELSAYSIVVTGSYDDGDASLSWSYPDVGGGSAGELESKAGYFAVAPLTVDIQGTRKLDGSEAHKTYRIEDVAAADHHILNIDAKVTGDANAMIDIDYTVNEKPVDIVVPGFDETPVPDEEEPEDPAVAAPSMTWPSNPSFATSDVVEGLDVTLNISAPGKIETFVVNVSENFQTMVSALTTGNVPYLDLINDKQVVSVLGEMGLQTGDQLYGKETLEFSLSSLIQMLNPPIGVPGEDYVFTLSLTDQLGQKLPEQPLTFHIPDAAAE